jgi:hypothetical protein
MRVTRFTRAMSERVVRVAILTAMLTTVACQCGTESVISQCLLDNEKESSCYLNVSTTTTNCTYTLSYIPYGSECPDCSRCRELRMTTISAGNGSSGCVSDCKIGCPPLESMCPSSLAGVARVADGGR